MSATRFILSFYFFFNPVGIFATWKMLQMNVFAALGWNWVRALFSDKELFDWGPFAPWLSQVVPVQQLSQKSRWNCQVGERGPCNLQKSGSSYWSSYFRVSCLWYYIMKAHFFKFSLPLPPCTLQITAEAAGARAAAALKVRQSSCCWSGSSVKRKILIWSPTSLHTQEVWALFFPINRVKVSLILIEDEGWSIAVKYLKT